MPSVILKAGKERRLVAGHPWVYAGEIAKITGDVADGDEVDLRDAKQRHLGRGLLNRKSKITVRRFTTGKEELNEEFFRARVAAAWAYRQQLGFGDAARVVFSESDQLPGLIVDKFGDCLVFQALTLGIEMRKPWVIRILRDLFHPRAIIERSDAHTRRLEGLAETKGVVFGQSDGRVTLAAAGLRFEVDLLADQKTGFFLDQCENYREIAAWSAGRRVLDCFSYHGGFALAAAAGGASQVEAVESSEAAVARARRNAELNGLTGTIEFTTANVFDRLKQYDKEKRTFDLVVLDPPSFTRTKEKVDDAVRGYKEINLRALKRLGPGGMLATFSCSHHIRGELFRLIVVDAAADARKTVRLVRTLTQSRDHPILPAVPESEYLRGLLLQVM
jgi:23S rRNA (cytosine1962-C5)-methyltransferase